MPYVCLYVPNGPFLEYGTSVLSEQLKAGTDHWGFAGKLL